jgi:hypothetical protein
MYSSFFNGTRVKSREIRDRVGRDGSNSIQSPGFDREIQVLGIVGMGMRVAVRKRVTDDRPVLFGG